MANCQSCDSCNSNCNNSCNSCNNCNSCNSNCQGACQSSKQNVSNSSVGNFYFRKNRLKKDDTFLTADEWNNLLNYINKGYNLKGQPLSMDVYNYDNKSIRAGKNYNNEFMSANMYNGAIAKMRYGSEGSGTPGTYEKTGGPNGDIVKAEYFRDLEDYFNNSFKVNYCNTCDNCNACNSNCQGGCNSCNSCNKCLGNDTCCNTPTTE